MNGVSPRRIATRLNQESIPAPRGGQWNASTINGSRQRRNGILNNEIYVGRITWNRQRFVKNPETGKRVSRINPEHEWITTEVPEFRIIDDASWERAQALKSQFSSRHGNKRQTKKRLLTGLVKCGLCCGSMTIISRERYYCSARRERGTCDSTIGISALELENRVLAGLKDILVDNENLIEAFATEFRAEVHRLRRERSGKQRQLRNELNTVNRAIKRCLTFITEGDGDPGLVRNELRELEGHKVSLEREFESSDSEAAIEIHPNLVELYRRKVGKLQLLLTDERTRHQAMELIRSMIDRIEVRAGEKHRETNVTLVGALAAILAYTQQKQTAVPKGDDGRVLMVAGVGFEPTTFRL